MTSGMTPEEAKDALERSIEEPVSNLLNDVEVALELVKLLKKVLDKSHPSVTSLVRKLLFS